MAEVTLSIIVPVYNVHLYLPRCVDSILSQTFTDFELILVDDGSTDSSGRICDEYAEKDSRIKVIHKKNEGVVSARKAGVLQACGVYAGYVDGDDWIETDMYEKMVHYMSLHDCDLVMCDIVHESRSLPLSSGGTSSDIENGYYDRKALEEKILPTMLYAGKFYKFGVYPVIWNKLYKREKLIEHQTRVYDNIKTGEDAACVYPYLLSADSMYFIKDMCLYHYRHSETSMTAAYDELYFKRFKSLYDFFSKSDLARSPYKNQLYYYYAYLIKISLGNELKDGNTLPAAEKIKNIKTICAFAASEGFLEKLNISAPHHRFYFRLIERGHARLLAAGIYAARFIQKLFRRKK